jgi:hypothetical protein
MSSITLGDLLGQDGAIALLVIGAALGFLAGRFFRGKEKGAAASSAASGGVQPQTQPQPPYPLYGKNTAVVAAITSAVNRYRSEN